MESVDAADMYTFMQRKAEQQAGGGKDARQESVVARAGSHGLTSELSALPDRFGRIEIQAKSLSKMESASSQGSRTSESQTAGPDDYRRKRGENSAINQYPISSKETTEVRGLRDRVGMSSETSIVGSPPSPVDSFDDDLSDDSDLSNLKISFHKSEVGRLIQDPNPEPARLIIHLKALVENHNIDDFKSSLYLAILYYNASQFESVIQTLKDFKYISSLPLDEGAMAYLIRGLSLILQNTPDSASGQKDCIKILQLEKKSKKHAKGSNLSLFANISNYLASVCASRLDNHADAMFFMSNYDSQEPSPSIKIGATQFTIQIPKSLRLVEDNEVLIDDHEGLEVCSDVEVPLHKVTGTTEQTVTEDIFYSDPTRATEPAGLLVDGTPDSVKLDKLSGLAGAIPPSLWIPTELWEIFWVKYLFENFGISVTTSNGMPSNLNDVENPRKTYICIGFKSTDQILDVLYRCQADGRLDLASAIVDNASHHRYGGKRYSLGYTHRVSYPKSCSVRPVLRVRNTFQFIALIDFPGDDSTIGWKFNAHKDGIWRLFLTLWAKSHDAELLYGAFILALARRNLAAACAIGESPRWTRIVYTDEIPKRIGLPMSLTSTSLIAIVLGQTTSNGNIVLIELLARWKDTVPNLFSCESPEIFGIAVRHANKSADGVKFLLENHRCKDGYHSQLSTCVTKATYIHEYKIMATPYDIVLHRASMTEDIELLGVLRLIAQTLSAVGANHTSHKDPRNMVSRKLVEVKGFPRWQKLSEEEE